MAPRNREVNPERPRKSLAETYRVIAELPEKLFNLCKPGNENGLISLLKTYPFIKDWAGEKDKSAISYAIEQNNWQALEIMLDYGVKFTSNDIELLILTNSDKQKTEILKRIINLDQDSVVKAINKQIQSFLDNSIDLSLEDTFKAFENRFAVLLEAVPVKSLSEYYGKVQKIFVLNKEFGGNKQNNNLAKDLTGFTFNTISRTKYLPKTLQLINFKDSDDALKNDAKDSSDALKNNAKDRADALKNDFKEKIMTSWSNVAEYVNSEMRNWFEKNLKLRQEFFERDFQLLRASLEPVYQKHFDELLKKVYEAKSSFIQKNGKDGSLLLKDHAFELMLEKLAVFATSGAIADTAKEDLITLVPLFHTQANKLNYSPVMAFIIVNDWRSINDYVLSGGKFTSQDIESLDLSNVNSVQHRTLELIAENNTANFKKGIEQKMLKFFEANRNENVKTIEEKFKKEFHSLSKTGFSNEEEPFEIQRKNLFSRLNSIENNDKDLLAKDVKDVKDKNGANILKIENDRLTLKDEQTSAINQFISFSSSSIIMTQGLQALKRSSFLTEITSLGHSIILPAILSGSFKEIQEFVDQGVKFTSKDVQAMSFKKAESLEKSVVKKMIEQNPENFQKGLQAKMLEFLRDNPIADKQIFKQEFQLIEQSLDSNQKKEFEKKIDDIFEIKKINILKEKIDNLEQTTGLEGVVNKLVIFVIKAINGLEALVNGQGKNFEEIINKDNAIRMNQIISGLKLSAVKVEDVSKIPSAPESSPSGKQSSKPRTKE